MVYRFDMTIQILVFFGGLAALVLGADLLVRGASRMALSFGPAMLSFVPPLTVVTLVVVMLRPAPPAGTRSA